MKLTTKGRYAVTAMLDLAINGRDETVCLGDIANRQDISLAYLEQLFTRLRRTQLVTSTRGPGGGYRLGRDPASISMADIVAAVNEPLDSTRCAGERDCQKGERCLTHQLWEDLNQHIQEFLKGVSLQDLLQRRDVQAVAARQCATEVPLRPMLAE